jgi:hypothetical protein
LLFKLTIFLSCQMMYLCRHLVEGPFAVAYDVCRFTSSVYELRLISKVAIFLNVKGHTF